MCWKREGEVRFGCGQYLNICEAWEHTFYTDFFPHFDTVCSVFHLTYTVAIWFYCSNRIIPLRQSRETNQSCFYSFWIQSEVINLSHTLFTHMNSPYPVAILPEIKQAAWKVKLQILLIGVIQFKTVGPFAERNLDYLTIFYFPKSYWELM